MSIWPVRLFIVVGSLLAALSCCLEIVVGPPDGSEGGAPAGWLSLVMLLLLSAAVLALGSSGASDQVIGVAMIIGVLVLIVAGIPIAVSLLLAGFAGIGAAQGRCGDRSANSGPGGTGNDLGVCIRRHPVIRFDGPVCQRLRDWTGQFPRLPRDCSDEYAEAWEFRPWPRMPSLLQSPAYLLHRPRSLPGSQCQRWCDRAMTFALPLASRQVRRFLAC